VGGAPLAMESASVVAANGMADRLQAKESDLSLRRDAAAPPPPPPPPPAPAAAAAVTVSLRTNFSETAFWQPQLLTGPDGSATFEFTVPDSVTSWNVWAAAITRDLRAGAAQAQTRTV